MGKSITKRQNRHVISRGTEIRLLVDSFVCAGLIFIILIELIHRKPSQLEPVYLINISVDLAAMVIGYLIYICSMIDGTLFNNRLKYFQYLLNVVYMGLFTDALAWLVNGLPHQRIANITVNTVYYMCLPVSCYFFWNYISEIMNPEEKMRRKMDIIVTAGMIGNLALCVANLFFGQYFTVNEMGEYARADYYIVHQIYGFFMILISMWLMIRQRRTMRFYQLVAMAMYLLAPLVVSVMTVAIYGLSVAYPIMMAVMLLMYCVVNVSRGREQAAAARDMAMAATIQNFVLPDKFPDRREFKLYASMNPAKEVGGDFYDFFLIDDDHLGMVIADVSGKGVPASLFMMVSKSLLKISLQSGVSPAEALRRVNEHLTADGNIEMFVTIWVAVLCLSTGEGVAANAGHEHPVYMRAGEKFELRMYKHSPPVAVMEDMVFTEHDFKMEKGDVLFVYTDGVCEAMSNTSEFFGEERLVEVLNRKPDADPQEVLENVSDSLAQFSRGAEQSDDITMLCLKYMGA